MAAGASYPPVTLTVNVGESAAASVTNNASVANGAEGPARTSNNAAADPTVVVSIANLSISKSNAQPQLLAGAVTSYSVVVQNPGPSAANGTVLTDPAVAGLNVTAVSCTSASGGAACPAAAGVTPANLQGAGITLTSLPAGGALTFTITATVTATGQ